MFKHFHPIQKTGSRLLLLVLLQVPFLGFIPQAVAAPPAGTKIENQATGSFLDPIDNGVKNIESNTVQVTMIEIAGITVIPVGYGGQIAQGGSAYFDFLITNVGNDSTQFFIPGTAGVTNGTLNSIKIIEVDPDGTGSGLPLTLPSGEVNVPITGGSIGGTTGTLLTLPNGSIPVGGTVKVRVAMTISPTTVISNPVTVIFGDTATNNNSASTQNQPYIASTTAGRDLYTQDNTDPSTIPNEAIGQPFNGDAAGHRQEASATQSINVAATVSGQVWEDANGSLAIDIIGGTVSETGTNAGSTALTIYAINSSGLVIAKSPVATNGTYSFSLAANTNYRLRLVNNSSLAIGAGATPAEAAALAPSLPSGYFNTGENFNGITETVTPGEIAITGLSANLTNYNFGIQRNGYCTIGSGVNDTSIQRYISTEAGNTSAAAAITNNLRNYSDNMDNNWRVATGGQNSGIAFPWFGTSSKPGSRTSFIYKEPNSNTPNTTTVTSLRIPFDATTACRGDSNSSANNSSGLLFGATMQEGAPRPTSLYNTLDQPGFWESTGASGNNSRSAVRFTFTQPVKSFGAWFGDLETRTIGNVPAYLRLLDSSGNRIGQDISIDSQDLYDGTSLNGTNPIVQTTCGGSSSNTPSKLGCGNRATRWIGFVDNASVARIQEVIVIVGDNNNGTDTSNQLSFIGANYQSIPNLLLVKRITRVNDSTTTSDGISTLGYIDDPNNPYDDNTISTPAVTPADTNLWPTDSTTNHYPLLAGAIDGGRIQPGKEVEYTIYFLSMGDDAAKGVVFCDRVPNHQIFSLYSFNATGTTGIGRGIQVSLNGITNNYTNNQDGDIGTFYPPGTTLPTACGTAANTQGAVVVNLGNIPSAKTNPNGAYGYVRFRARVE